MNKEQILSDLRQSRRTLLAAIDFIKSLPDDLAVRDAGPVYSSQASERFCKYCGKLILPDDDEVRDVHRRCYNKMHTLVRNGERSSIEEFFEEGRLGPSKKGGRPKTTEDRAEEIAADPKKKVRKGKL